MPLTRLCLAATLVAALAPLPLLAQHAGHTGHTGHAGHDHSAMHRAAPAGAAPSELGDGIYAAIAQIVTVLSEDPQTDWSRVDIAALRAHLLDMRHLMLGAEVDATPVPGGLRMRIATQGQPGAAATRMVPAHAPVLAAETGWTAQVAQDGDALIWTVTASTAQDAAKISALGFFGLMALGDHHHLHHLALARGDHG